MASAAMAAGIQVTVVDQEGNAVNDAVVYIKTVNGEKPMVEPLEREVDQIEESFVPHVRAITVGSAVHFPNSDDIRHHVYSFSDAKTFELPLYIGTPAEPVIFDRPGLVSLGCNIHDHMLAYVLVLESSYFAEVREGAAAITDFPGGSLEVALWHPRLINEEEILRNMTVAEGETAALNLAVELRPERKVRRAPKRRGRSRY